MGFTRALEILHALLHAHESRLLPPGGALPFPHLQQRLQQTLRAVSLTATGAVAVPLLLLTAVPWASPWSFPGFFTFSFVCAPLVALALLQIVLRYVLVPLPRQSLVSDPLTAMQGFAQTAACAAVDVAAPLYRDPQLLVLLAFCVFHAWVWKTALYYSVALPSDAVDADFSTFVLVSGTVTFLSWLAVEPRLDADPFVLDPRSAFVNALQRDFVRAVRRAVVSYALTRAVLLVSGISFSISGILGHLFTINVGRAFFHITTGVLESFVALVTASVFRILFFRASYAVMNASNTDGDKLWDAADAQAKARSGVDALFQKQLEVSLDATAALDEQYVQALEKRVSSAMQTITARDARAAAPAYGDVSGSDKDVEDLNAFLVFENLQLVSKFDSSNRKALYSSFKRWQSLFSATTAVIDSFTVSLQLLNAIPSRKSQASAGANDVVALEQSVPNLLKFLAARSNMDPLLLLDQFPHLSNLRISSAGFKSKIHYYFESRVQFAVRRFLMQEAKRHVFRASRVRPLFVFPTGLRRVAWLTWPGEIGCPSCPEPALPSREQVARRGRPGQRQGTMGNAFQHTASLSGTHVLTTVVH